MWTTTGIVKATGQPFIAEEGTEIVSVNCDGTGVQMSVQQWLQMIADDTLVPHVNKQ
jgi:hypothetical protein